MNSQVFFSQRTWMGWLKGLSVVGLVFTQWFLWTILCDKKNEVSQIKERYDLLCRKRHEIQKHQSFFDMWFGCKMKTLEERIIKLALTHQLEDVEILIEKVCHKNSKYPLYVRQISFFFHTQDDHYFWNFLNALFVKYEGCFLSTSLSIEKVVFHSADDMIKKRNFFLKGHYQLEWYSLHNVDDMS